LLKRFSTDVKVYRAYNKNHLFFTVFGKEAEEKLHSELKISSEQTIKFLTKVGEDKGHEFRVISYQAYEAELKARIVESDRIVDTPLEHILILN
jgi:hypothetical protein